MLEVDINFASPNPNACPTTLVELVAELDTLVSGTVIGDFLPYITGTATPSADDQDKVWHRLDTNGKPIGTFLFFQGAWRKQYTGRLGQICLYSGDPNFDFDATGRGRLEGDAGSTGEWDGWHLCNGQNGTQDFSDKFIVGGKRYNAGWETDVSGGPTKSGVGIHEITLTNDTTYRPTRPAIPVRHWTADGSTPNAGGGLIGLGSEYNLLEADTGNTTPNAIPTLPPYLACAYVVFVGYL